MEDCFSREQNSPIVPWFNRGGGGGAMKHYFKQVLQSRKSVFPNLRNLRYNEIDPALHKTNFLKQSFEYNASMAMLWNSLPLEAKTQINI